MRWQDERVMIRRGTLIGSVVGSASALAILALCAGILLSLLFGGPPPALVLALLILFTLRLTLSVVETASSAVRRARRRRRMRSLSSDRT